MIGLDLPQITPGARPAFEDAADCARWLERLPIVNAAAAHSALAAKLEALNAAHVPAQERIAMLELLRGPVATVQAEQAKKYGGKPLPLSRQRRELLESVTALWDSLGLGYQRALAALAAIGHDPAALATACHRALDCTARAMLEHTRAYVQPRPADLRQLHRLYSTAERQGVATLVVADPLARGRRSRTCTRTYVRALLFDASSPRERAPEHVELVDRWLDLFAPKVTLLDAPPRGTQRAPLAVDLDSDTGATRRPGPGGTLRFLETAEVAKSLLKRIHGVRRGRSLGELGLDGDLAPAVAERVLVALYRHWCDAEPRRAHERHDVSGAALVCAGLSGAHYGLGGHGSSSDDATVPGGRVFDTLVLSGIAPETWALRDESLSGLGLVRRRDDSRAARIAHGQLMLVHPEGGRSGMVAAVQWLQEAADGDMHVGARILPGVPEPVTVRASEGGSAAGVALSALPALDAPPTLVLPPGWFRPERPLEVRSQAARRVRLKELVERGVDFERVRFEPAE